jgi:hypothetical protein
VKAQYSVIHRQNSKVASDCGTTKSISVQSLRNGKTVSCGCYGRRMLRESNENPKIIHGHAGRKPTKEYSTWSGMMSRCNNANHTFYDHHGGRGITVCEQWHSFEKFLADMGERPANHSLERIDNNKGYSNDNCKWATQTHQNNNKRNNHTVTYDGRTQTISQWSAGLNMNYQTLWRRLKAGWSIEDALCKEVKEFNVIAMLLHRKENKFKEVIE